MRKAFLIFTIVLIIFSCKGVIKTDTSFLNLRVIDSLYQNHQYFVLRDKINEHGHQLTTKELMLSKAQILSVFNQREVSNKLIEKLQKHHQAVLTAKQTIDLLETQVSNSLFLFDYAAAREGVLKLLANDSLSSEKRIEYENQLLIFKDLTGTPPQTIDFAPSNLPIEKDIAGLLRIPAKINAVKKHLVFDTGANFSVITDSLALKSGIRIKEAIFKVTAITGEEVNSKIGIADSLRIGNSILHNVVFLVFPKSSLSFEKANYTIDAILGFPVINALGKIELIGEKKLVLTGSSPISLKANMALDLLTPIVEVHQNGKSLPFTLDTGANATALYEPYLKLHEPFLLIHGIRDTINQGGAGGSVRIPVYKGPFIGAIGNRKFQLDTALIHIKNQNDYPGIYGNLGRDVLKQFDTLSLDFKYMRIELK